MTSAQSEDSAPGETPTRSPAKGLRGKIAAATALLLAAGALIDASIAAGTKARTMTCSLDALGIQLPWCPASTASDARDNLLNIVNGRGVQK
jgi:hypothetical protein